MYVKIHVVVLKMVTYFRVDFIVFERAKAVEFDIKFPKFKIMPWNDSTESVKSTPFIFDVVLRLRVVRRF